jgi:hypothetical protein
MLRQISNKEVIGTSFTVIVQNIHQIRYTENNHSAIIQIEGGEDYNGNVDWVIYQATLQNWEPPYDTDALTIDKRVEIFSRISESLTVLGMPYRFF